MSSTSRIALIVRRLYHSFHKRKGAKCGLQNICSLVNICLQPGLLIMPVTVGWPVMFHFLLPRFWRGSTCGCENIFCNLIPKSNASSRAWPLSNHHILFSRTMQMLWRLSLINRRMLLKILSPTPGYDTIYNCYRKIILVAIHKLYCVFEPVMLQPLPPNIVIGYFWSQDNIGRFS